MNSVSEEPGDLFEAPPRSALIHACSARGSWGKGIALDFARKYPWAYRRYRQHCLKQKDKNEVYDIPDLHATGDGTKTVSVRWPVGTALIIYPESLSFPSGANPWIICLFTSFDYGKRVDSPQMILNSTNAALHDLQNQLITMEGGRQFGFPAIDRLYSCRFNSGLFGVPWAKTRQLVDKVPLGLPLTIVYPPEEEQA